MTVGTWRVMGEQRVIVWVLGIIGLWATLVLWQPTRVDVVMLERRIEPFLQGFYAPETASDGTAYRWSDGAGIVQNLVLPASQHVLWGVTVAAPLVPLGLDINELTVLHAQRRHYFFFAPTTQWWGENTLVLRSTRFADENEARMLGVRVVAVRVQQPVSLFPAAGTFVAGLLLLIGFVVGARVVGMRPAADVAALLAALAVVALLHWLDRRAAAIWMRELAAIAILVPPVCLLLRRWFPVALSTGWGVVLAIRLWGIRYPGFEGHDYQIHLRRLAQFRTGILSLVAHPYEYGRRQSIILPLYYRFADALAQLLSAPLAMHLIIVVAETSVALMVYQLLVRAELTPRAALFAALGVLLVPLSSTVLYWAFMQQITAHVVTFAIAATALSTRRRDHWLSGVLLAVVGLTHIGEALIAAVWYTALRLGQVDRFSAAWWRRWISPVLALGTVIPVYQPFLIGVGQDRGTLLRGVSPDVWAQMGVAVEIAVAPIPLAAAVLLVGVFALRRPRLVLPWALTTAGFWLVEVMTQAQVRYLYTGAPLVFAALGVALAPVWQRGRAAKVLVCL
ncbi:MAG: hypothetical protein RLZZ297_738, partial [Chloroflexota bacterium]